MSDKMLSELQVAVSKPQLQKLANGGTIQISPAVVGSGVSLYLDKKKHKKIMRAISKGKGARLSMAQHEIDGSGLWDVLKTGWNVLKSVVPIRQVATNIAQKALPALAGAVAGPKAQQVVGDITQKYAEPAVAMLGEKAGFGVKKRGRPKKGSGVKAAGVKAAGLRQAGMGAPVEGSGCCSTCGAGIKKGGKKKASVDTSSSYFMSSGSAAMNPPAQSVPDQSFRIPLYHGGSGILPAGYRR